ncbi:hypothetical protein [Roseobacter sp. S98]|uniref:hypothetical protein n=1 Tax=Roseobacter algicola (ex Choi et al. 2025) (nom. illeg.) TaxID=3092138 RepID=UPI003F513418
MTTPDGRLAWFCAHFELTPPPLSYDEDEPDSLLMTDELIEFCGREGLSLDWFTSGRVCGPLAVYREKYRITPEVEKWAELLGKFDDHEKTLLTAGLKLVTQTGADIDDVMQGVTAEIEAYRQIKKV